MLTTYLNINALDVAGRYREPAWRDTTAQRLDEEGLRPSPRLHDRTTIRLTNFYQQRRLCDNDFDRAALLGSAGPVAEAVEMHELGCHGPACILEATVLADEPHDRIAQRLRTTSEVVELYELAFCDIRTRLTRHDFVIQRCIGLQNVGRDRQKFACAAMRFFAYLCGSEAIDLFSFTPGAPSRWQSVAGLVSTISQRARLLLKADMLTDDRFADPRAKLDLMRVMESLDQWSDTYDDELTPKSRDERDVAQLLKAKGGQIPWAPFQQ